MRHGTAIEWTHVPGYTGESWNPVRARNRKTDKLGWHCVHKSDGCRFCYAEAFNLRLGTGLPFKPGHEKDIEIFLDETMLLRPLQWQKPRAIFVHSMTDSFADFVHDEWLDRIFAVAALCPQHIFIFVTKRPERMREYMCDPTTPERAWALVDALIEQWDDGKASFRLRTFDGDPKIVALGSQGATWGGELPWPLRNIWLGVSAEDQERADERVPDLLATPAAVRWVSAEPLLGPIVIPEVLYGADGSCWMDPLRPTKKQGRNVGINWIVAGGESGNDARPMHPDWARSIRDQCKAAGVAFHFKQWGSCLPVSWDGEDERGRLAYIIEEEHCTIDYDDLGRAQVVYAHDRDFARFSHKNTGRLLDGVTHDQFPEVRG